MATIRIINRSTKSEGSTRVRFRIREQINGRSVELYHKSDIIASLNDLAKLDANGLPKERVRIYNHDLVSYIQEEINNLADIFASMVRENRPLTSEVLVDTYNHKFHPEMFRKESRKILDMYAEFFETRYEEGHISPRTRDAYKLIYKQLERFLIIVGKSSISIDDFSADLLLSFRDFIQNEHRYVNRWRGLYVGVLDVNIPTKERNTNTVAARLKKLKAFYQEMCDLNKTDNNPFRLVGRDNRRTMLREQFTEPISLNIDEFNLILNKEVPGSLQECKDLFLLQCAVGARISDFKRISWENIVISVEGIPVYTYLAKKTSRIIHDDVETPLMRFAFDIIKKYDCKFPLLSYVSGQSGYNAKIKKLLEYCGIDRQCKIFDNDRNTNVCVPIYEFASNKICRKVHETLMSRVQIQMYASGLHAVGSAAIANYVDMSLEDRFQLMCLAFEQESYRVDKNMNIIKNE